MVHNRVGTLVATPTLLIFDRSESPEKVSRCSYLETRRI
jgi:hypothetical protein